MLGRGQGVSGNFSIGSQPQDFILNVNDPYFMDTKVALGFDAFNTTREYDDFDEKKIGFWRQYELPAERLSHAVFWPAANKETRLGRIGQ